MEFSEFVAVIDAGATANFISSHTSNKLNNNNFILQNLKQQNNGNVANVASSYRLKVEGSLSTPPSGIKLVDRPSELFV